MLILEKSLKTLYSQFPRVSYIHVHKSSFHKLLTTHGNSRIHTKKLQHQYCGWFNFSLLSASQQNDSYKHSSLHILRCRRRHFLRGIFSFMFMYGEGGTHTTAQVWRSEVNLWEEPILFSQCVFQGSNSGY